MSSSSMSLRRGRPSDAAALTDLHVWARAAGMPWLIRVHDDDATELWMRTVVLAQQAVWVAERDGRPVGFAAADAGELEQCYVAPEAWGTGVGRALVDAVSAERPGGLRLHVFTRNERARRFYEAAGFVLVATGDGSGNEAGGPGCTYARRRSIGGGFGRRQRDTDHRLVGPREGRPEEQR